MSADKLLSRLDGVQGKGPRWRAICPAHESKHGTRSLSIYEPEPGRVLLHCFAGCDVGAVAGSLGLSLSDLFPPRERDPSQPARSIRKPWRASDVVSALRGELYIAGVILSDVVSGAEIDEAELERARVAIEHIGAFLDELEHAH